MVDGGYQQDGIHTQDSAHDEPTSARRLALVAGLNLLAFLGQVIGGLFFGSIALLSDGIHSLFDALAYLLAFGAGYLATRSGPTEWYSYGFHRLEPLAAFLNGLLLLPMVGYIIWESLQRVTATVTIMTGPTLVLAGAGFAINIVSVFLLHHDQMSLNERGAFAHLLGDAGGSLAVIGSVLIIDLTGWQLIDPLVAVVIGGLILWTALAVLTDSGAIVTLQAPVAQSELRAAIEAVDGIQSVTDLHTWQLCSHLTIATVHATTTANTTDGVRAATQRVHGRLADRGIEHATVELRPAGMSHEPCLTCHTH